MQDSVKIFIGDFVIDRFISYSIESNVYTADSAFVAELVPGSVKPKGGEVFRLYVNNKPEMIGIIDAPERGYSQAGRSLSISGRDLLGIIIDSYVETFMTVENATIRKVANILLKSVPYINRNYIDFEPGIEKIDTPQGDLQLEPGQKIFDVLKRMVMARGLLFYAQSTGRICCRRPKTNKDSQPLFTIQVKNLENLSDIVEAKASENITNRFSKYIIIGQEQGEKVDTAEEVNCKSIAKDESFPFYKPFVEVVELDKEAPAHRANLLKNKAIAEAFSYSYTVKGHQNSNHNWKVNELVTINDDELDVHDILLICGRTFRLNRYGAFSDLKLSKPWSVAA